MMDGPRGRRDGGARGLSFAPLTSRHVSRYHAGMLRLRDTSGKAVDVEESVRFVELCGDDGKVACVVYQMDDGALRIIEPGSEEFDRYLKLFGLQGARIFSFSSPPPLQSRHV